MENRFLEDDLPSSFGLFSASPILRNIGNHAPIKDGFAVDPAIIGFQVYVFYIYPGAGEKSAIKLPLGKGIPYTTVIY